MLRAIAAIFIVVIMYNAWPEAVAKMLILGVAVVLLFLAFILPAVLADFFLGSMPRWLKFLGIIVVTAICLNSMGLMGNLVAPFMP